MSQPELERRPSRRVRASERSALYLTPLDQERCTMSEVDLPSSPMSEFSCAGSWSESSNTQEHFTPRTPEFWFPPATAIATPDEITVTLDHQLRLAETTEYDKTVVASLPILPPKESTPVKTVQSKLSHRVDSRIKSIPVSAQREVDQPPPSIAETRHSPYDLSAPENSAATLTQLLPSVWRRGVQQASQKDAPLSSASLSYSPSLPPDDDMRIPPIALGGPLSEDEVKKVQSFLRELRECGDLENSHTQQESSPPLRPGETPLLLPKKTQYRASDEFSWEARHADFLDADEPADPTRCSLLIQEVSLMVGLTSDDDQPNPNDGSLPVPNVPVHSGPKTTRDAPLPPLPLDVVPAEALALRKRENPRLPASGQIACHVYPSEISISLDDKPFAKNANATAHSDYPFLKETSPPVRPRGLSPVIPRHKSADAINPTAQSRRRHGQVFQFDRPTDDTRNDTQTRANGGLLHLRAPVPRPTLNFPPSRLSSLNRLECSLEKLKAHAPTNHHKSQSEGTNPSYLGRKEKPPLPMRQQSNFEISYRNAPRPARGRHFSSPMPPVSGSPANRSYVVEPTRSTAPSEDEHPSTPGSFMDMDIPAARQARHKKRISLRYATNNEKMKNLVRSAKRMSRRVITWGKNLAGPSKPLSNGVKAAPIQNTYI